MSVFEGGRFGSGQAVKRIEDDALLTGRGRYTDDIAVSGLTHLAFARSPHAHARITSIDTSTAQGMPGVLAVYTGAQLVDAGVQPLPGGPLQRPDGKPMVGAARHALAHEVARYVGEPVAGVVAESRDAARAAADAIWVDYEALPAVVDARQAIQPGAPVLCPQAPDNVAAGMRHGDAAATEAAFARAAVRVSLELVNQRLAASPIEPRTVLAEMDDGRLKVTLSHQAPTAVRDGLAKLLGMREEQVRVLVHDVGGGFGMKSQLYQEDVVVAHAARQLQRPVRWRGERIEEFLSTTHGRDLVSQAELALDADGRVLALRVKSLANIGAYAGFVPALIQLLVGPWVSTSIYDIQTIALDLRAVMTNCAPTGPYRGAGRPEAIYIIERLMDAAARELKLDPAELRRRNMIRPEQMPYRTPMQQVYDVGEFEKILDQALALADWPGYTQRREQSKARGLLRGRGIATFLEWTGGGALQEEVSVRVSGDGFIEIISATQQMGQGIQTSYAQLAVDVFGVGFARIRILQGDTDRANGFGSAGSRSLFTGGAAVQVASERTIEHSKQLAAQTLEAPAADIEYTRGRFVVAGTDLAIDLFELAGQQPKQQIIVSGSSSASAPSWPNACHICEVEIDPETGEVKIVAYASVNDIGRIVNPAITRGQIDGGAMQGIGQALCEQVVYDKSSGQLLTASFLDYALPRADQFNDFKTEFDQSVPCTTNLLGAKGCGELGTIGATPAVVNAVIDALHSAGLGSQAQGLQMPCTPERVWRILHKREAAA